MKKLLLVAVTAVMLSTPALAASDKPLIEQYTDPVMQAVVNNFHHEMVECIAFYQISFLGMTAKAENEDNNEAATIAQKALEIATALYERALLFHNADVTKARMEMGIQTMMETMGGSWNNYSLVLNKFAYPCKEVFDNPDGRIAYWANKAGIN